MKKLSVILAILFLAFAVQAQTVEKSKRNTKKETETTRVNKTNSKASRTKEVKAAPASKSRSGKTSTSSSKATTGRNTNNSSGKSATRSNVTRTTRTSTTVTRQTGSRNTGSTQVKREGENRSGSSRTVSGSSSSQQRTGSGNVQRNQSSKVDRNYNPRTAPKDVEARKVYTVRHQNRVIRPVPSVHYRYEPLEYRRIHNPYNRPVLSDIYWDARMYRNYRLWYPDFNLWYYPFGYRIQMVSAYDSYNYIGEVARIYGVVSEVWYSPENRSYYLYVGGPYPYQDFTIVVEDRDARRFSRDPVRFFTNRQLTVTGLVSVFDGKPEMLIKRKSQIHLY